MSSDPDAPMPAAETPTEFEAQAIAALLRDAGVEAIVESSGSATPGLGLSKRPPPSRVMVRERDLALARRIVAQRRAESAETDWETFDPGERTDTLPLHRSGRRPLLATIALVVGLALVAASLVGGLAMALFG